MTSAEPAGFQSPNPSLSVALPPGATAGEPLKRGFNDFGGTSEVASALFDAELSSYIDTDVPTTSRLVLYKPIKSTVRKLASFYIRFVAEQITVLARSLVKAMRAVAEEANAKVGLVPTLKPAPLAPVALESAAEFLTSAQGRVLVLDAATPELLVALEDSGVDAYGIAPSINTSPADTQELRVRAFDLRKVPAKTHLGAIPHQTLGGVLLIGFVDQAPVGRKLELLTSALGVCQPGARVVVATDPTPDWRTRLDPIAQDLVEGRPLRPETWQLLLEEHGVDDITVIQPDPNTALITGRLR